MLTIEKENQIKQAVKRDNQLINIHLSSTLMILIRNRRSKPTDRFQIENRKTNLLRWKKLEDGLRCLNGVDLRSFESRPRERQEEEIDKRGTDREREDELIQISITDPLPEKPLFI